MNLYFVSYYAEAYADIIITATTIHNVVDITYSFGIKCKLQKIVKSYILKTVFHDDHMKLNTKVIATTLMESFRLFVDTI